MPLHRSSKRHRALCLLLSITFVIVYSSFVSAAETGQTIRVRIFSLRNISAQQGKDFLAKSKISDSAVIIPGTNALSVTASPEALVQASNLLKLVDSNEPYEIKFVDIEDDKKIPDSLAIETKLGPNFSVGTLLEGTANAKPLKVIVDKVDDQMFIAAPGIEIDSIIKSVNEVAQQQQEKEKADRALNEPNKIGQITAAEPNFSPEPNQPQTAKKKTGDEDDMLGEFMDELAKSAKADKDAKKKKIVQAPKSADVNFIKPVEPGTEITQNESETRQDIQPETSEDKQIPQTEEITLVPEANDAEEIIKGIKTPAINEINIPNRDEVLELNLPEQLEIVTLIDLVGRYLNLNYLYDSAKVQGNVNIKVQGQIRVGELYSLLESVLKFKNLSMSRKGNLVTIVPLTEALDQDPVLIDGTARPGDVAVTKVFHLKYINTASARKLLTEMKLGSNITEIPEIGTLVITEYAFRMQRIEDLLKLVDVPGPPKDFKLRVLKYTLAESLVPKIKALAEQLGTVEITIGATSAETAPMPGRITRPAPRPVTQPIPGQSTTATGETTAKGVYIDFDKRTNRVLMIGLDSDLKSVDKIIDSLDVPQQDLRTIREYEIQFIDITKIVEALQQLNIIEQAISTSTTGMSRRPTVTRPGGPGETVPQPNINQAMGGSEALSANLLDQPQVVMLESTNSLLVNATPEQHIQITKIISYIDREPIEAAIPYRIYRLENQDPEELAETLNGLISKTTTDAQGKIQETVKYTDENIVIVPDKNTFSLVVYASKKNQEWIGNLIKSLDKRRPQVLIDVSLVEITQDDVFNYDLDIVGNAKGAAVDTLAVTGGAISTAATGRTFLEGKTDSGNFTGFYSNDSIQALLKLIDTKKYGRVLARPKVLVNDNEEGTISTEDTRYVGQTTATTVAGTAGAASDSVVQSTTFTPYTAKIELKITPQISEGNLLRLEVEMQRNDFQEGTSTKVNDIESPLNEKKSSVNTIVTVPDGSTIILGGLVKLGQTKATQKAPILGDIPIAGTLFRNAAKNVHDSKLYIFVKANILRPEDVLGLDQLKQISVKNRTEFERDEAKFQKYELFPGVKETPIDPNRVLEQ
ncbi:MAG: secretin N-terminal domain-containing protein [Phycisphaerales bacterium]